MFDHDSRDPCDRPLVCAELEDCHVHEDGTPTAQM